MMKVIVYILSIILLIVFIQFSLSGKQGNPHGNIKYDCIECHGSESWQYKKDGKIFDHGKTGFPLTGGHQNTDCRSCHENLVFHFIGTSCIDCHTDIHKNELGINCEDCHTPLNWENRQEILKEHGSTQFPLIGVHAVVECEACHTNQQRNEYKNTPVDCEYCHHNSFKETTNPNHQLANFQVECVDCHKSLPTTWNDTNWKHPLSFDLKGAHKNTDCIECHENTFQGTSSECITCHLIDYQSAIFPNHVQLGYPEDCSVCHTEERWQGAVFDHRQNTGYELREAHANLYCQDCHINGQITGLPTDCFGCHQNDYNSVQDPNHVTGQFPTDCLRCHNETVWNPAVFDHNNTQFPLQGAHTSIDCIDCHTNGYASIPTDCWSCHETDFNNVTDPNHVTNNFDRNCTVCHTQVGWTPAFFDHSNTSFPLTGAHTTLDCIACHANGYANTPSDCWSCHESDFTGVSDPNHITNNFSHDCTLCHSTSAWSPASFDHSNTNFPLTGAHLTLDCIECHANGYAGTPTDCFSCHETNYNNTTNPNHLAAGFPIDCEPCHNTMVWTPSTWDHDSQYFPIYSGRHEQEWTTCDECHVDPNDFTIFECIFCHEHSNQTQVNNDHSEVTNYVYASWACYDCHPDGLVNNKFKLEFQKAH